LTPTVNLIQKGGRLLSWLGISPGANEGILILLGTLVALSTKVCIRNNMLGNLIMHATPDLKTALFSPQTFHYLKKEGTWIKKRENRSFRDFSHCLSTAIENFASKEDELLLKNLKVSIVGSVKTWSRTMAAQYGSDFWQLSKKELRGDGRSAAWIDIMESISNSHRQDALDGLSALATKGITWKIPGGFEKTEIQADYGVTFMHLVSIRVLNALEKVGKEIAPLEASNREQTTGKVVTVRPVGSKLSLFFGDHRGQLIGEQCKDFLLLCSIREDRSISDIDLWSQIWPNQPYQRDRSGGADGKIRDLVRRVNRILEKKLGNPPNGDPWVQRNDEFRYALNSSVQWKFRLN
jgi:hypothetical protein